MSPDRFSEAEAIFQEVADLPTAAREEILSERCEEDAELLALVERLLAHHDGGMGGFLEAPERRETATFESTRAQPRRIGHNEILRKLGEGGMGTVFLARQEIPRRTVALKVLRPGSMGSSLLKRFRFEIQVLGQLNHPGIAQVYEAGTSESGVPYFAMEYVPGEPLMEFARQRELTARERLELMARVCDAVHYAHEKGVIHRDLKPANILVRATEGEASQPKILDFGVARAVHSDLQPGSLYTQTGQLVGTLAYMSPEQLRGRPEDLDVRSDVYQLGVVLYELLAGRHPIDVGDLSTPDAIRRVVEEEPDRLGTLETVYRGDVETIVGKALEKDRQRRYQTAAELSADLRRHMNDEPIIARPPSATYRLKKYLKRKRGMLGSLAAGLVVAAAGILLYAQLRAPDPIPRPPLQARQLTAVTEDVAITWNGLSLSPDGATLAYSCTGILTLKEIDSGAQRVLVDRREQGRMVLAVAWRPPGGEILSEEWDFGRTFEIWLTDADTGNRRLVHEIDQRSYPAMAPDGESFVFLRNDRREIWVKNLSGDGARKVLGVESGEEVYSAVWAPSGHRLAYIRVNCGGRPGRTRLESCDLEGNTRYLLTEESLFYGDFQKTLCWLSDGRLLHSYWCDASYQSTELWTLTVHPRTGEVKEDPVRFLAFPGTIIDGLTASADGGELSYLNWRVARRPMLLDMRSDAAEPEAHRLGSTDWPTTPMVWTADSRRLFLRVNRTAGDDDIFLYDLETGREDEFIATPENDVPLCLSPDGSELLYWQGSQLMAVTVAGGVARHVADYDDGGGDIVDSVAGDFVAPRIRSATAPESLCVMGEVIGTDMVIRSVNPKKGIGDELLRLPLDTSEWMLDAFFDLSPDGRRVALTETNGRIRVVDVHDGTTRELPQDLGRIQSVSWSRDGRWLYLSGMETTAAYWIGRVSAEDGGSEVLWTSNHIHASWPIPSPDGGHLAFRTFEMSANAYMIKDF